MSERGSSAALYRQKSREYIPTTLALSAARFSVTTLQRLPGGLAELEALAEQLPPEDRAPDPMPSSPPRSHRVRERGEQAVRRCAAYGKLFSVLIWPRASASCCSRRSIVFCWSRMRPSSKAPRVISSHSRLLGGRP